MADRRTHLHNHKAQQNKQNKTMTNTKTLAMIAVGLAVSAAASQAAVDISTIGSWGPSIILDGKGGISFETDDLGTGIYHFIIKSSSTVAKDSKNYLGLITGPISFDTSGKITAGSTTLKLFKGPDVFSATLDLTGQYLSIDKSTLSINAALGNNLSSIIYSGPSTDLAAFKEAGIGTVNFSFQFGEAISIGSLYNNKTLLGATITDPTTGSATLTFAPVPEPSTYIAGLGALALFGFTAIPRRKKGN